MPMQGKVIFTDLDGTLFYPKAIFRMVKPKTRKFLTRFHQDGGKLVLVSSRTQQFFDRVERNLGFPIDGIGADGSFVRINGETVFDRAFESWRLKELYEELRRKYKPHLFLLTTKNHPLIATRTDTSRFTNLLYVVYEAFQGVYRDAMIRSDHLFFNEIERGVAYKLMMLVGVGKKAKARSEKLTKELAEAHPEFEFVWLGEFIEITPKGCSKADGVAFYLASTGARMDNTIVVGDSGNDVPMFDRFHSVAYCMSHSPASVQSHASHIIDRVSDLEQVLYPSVDSKETPKKDD